MNNQEYEQKLQECWEEFCKEHPLDATANGGVAFSYAFDRAYALGKQAEGADGEKMLTVSRKRVQEMYAHYDKICNDPNRPKDYIESVYEYADGVTMALDDLFGSKCLPDEKPKSCGELLDKMIDIADKIIDKIEPKPAEPKFKMGDKVVIIANCKHQGEVTEIIYVDDDMAASYKLDIYDDGKWYTDADIEPYTEPEKESRNLSKNIVNCDKQLDNILKDSFSKERRLNIAVQVLCAIIPKYKDNFDGIGLSVQAEKDMIKDAFRIADALLAECEKGGSDGN